MKISKTVSLRGALTLALVAGALWTLSAGTAPPATAGLDVELAREIDAVMGEMFKPGEPGAAVIVVRDGKTLFRKGYGMANLELGVAVEPDMIFRIGSMTKQFTAAAILLLAEEGKLSLQDEVTKYLPGVKTGGKKITLEHLLTHTSGLPSYTEAEGWPKLWRQDMSIEEILDLTKDKPLEFAPGERWNYCNTGYVMLGAVVEKVSGQTFGDFVEAKIFKPLGMNRTSYDSTERVIPHRIPGYHQGKDGFINAPYLSMTQPHAAGALISTVDDLALWNEAVFAGKVLKAESLGRAITPFKTTGGESTGYGYGWMIGSLRGHRTVEHGGGIMGFSSYGLSLPDDGIYVAVLTNGVGPGRDPESRAVRVAEAALNLPPEAIQAVTVPEKDLDALVGVYEGPTGQTRYITREGDKLCSQRKGSQKYTLTALSPTEFRFPDSPTRLLFHKDDQGKVDGVRLETRVGMAETYRKTDKPLPAARKEITLEPKLLERYVGEYELQPGFSLVFTAEDGRLMIQATGQPKFEVFPESETRFFLKVVDAQVEFTLGEGGKATGLTLHQAGAHLPGKRIR
ncbi:MAG: serine hydrolase [Acidobacteria bacterium]|nr:serine hydrolase [Acidobacteriota bacterium]